MSEAQVDEPLRHIHRVIPPWTKPMYTECGRLVADVAGEVVTLDDVVAFVRRHGKQRASFVHCMTCWGRVSYGQFKWEKNPEEVVRHWVSRRDDDVRAHLYALAALVAHHRDEYDALVAGEGVTSLADRRRGRTQGHPSTGQR